MKIYGICNRIRVHIQLPSPALKYSPKVQDCRMHTCSPAQALLSVRRSGSNGEVCLLCQVHSCCNSDRPVYCVGNTPLRQAPCCLPTYIQRLLRPVQGPFRLSLPQLYPLLSPTICSGHLVKDILLAVIINTACSNNYYPPNFL